MSAVEVNRARALAGVAHGFLGRRGGVSTGVHAGLNVGLGSQDDAEAIAENRRRASGAVLPGGKLATVFQVHSADAVIATAPFDERPHADAIVSNTPGLAIGILTADCAPVLFADREANVVAAAHAGWKGALGGVTDSTIALMETLGAKRERIVAAVGPCIARASYEVDAGFFRRFAEADPANERFFADGKPEHYQFDLEAYVANRLAEAGIRTVETLGEDTYAQPERFYSFRRATHHKESDYGRQISIIGIN
ncbi:MAG: peptidoglycan editing factor PgeF [Pseudomonadota bacterium]